MVLRPALLFVLARFNISSVATSPPGAGTTITDVVSRLSELGATFPSPDAKHFRDRCYDYSSLQVWAEERQLVSSEEEHITFLARRFSAHSTGSVHPTIGPGGTGTVPRQFVGFLGRAVDGAAQCLGTATVTKWFDVFIAVFLDAFLRIYVEEGERNGDSVAPTLGDIGAAIRTVYEERKTREEAQFRWKWIEGALLVDDSDELVVMNFLEMGVALSSIPGGQERTNVMKDVDKGQDISWTEIWKQRRLLGGKKSAHMLPELHHDRRSPSGAAKPGRPPLFGPHPVSQYAFSVAEKEPHKYVQSRTKRIIKRTTISQSYVDEAAEQKEAQCYEEFMVHYDWRTLAVSRGWSAGLAKKVVQEIFSPPEAGDDQVVVDLTGNNFTRKMVYLLQLMPLFDATVLDQIAIRSWEREVVPAAEFFGVVSFGQKVRIAKALGVVPEGMALGGAGIFSEEKILGGGFLRGAEEDSRNTSTPGAELLFTQLYRSNIEAKTSTAGTTNKKELLARLSSSQEVDVWAALKSFVESDDVQHPRLESSETPMTIASSVLAHLNSPEKLKRVLEGFRQDSQAIEKVVVSDAGRNNKAFHALGKVRLPLLEVGDVTVLIHLWHPDKAVEPMDEFQHTHCNSFASHVVQGRARHVVYRARFVDPSESEEDKKTFQLYKRFLLWVRAEIFGKARSSTDVKEKRLAVLLVALRRFYYLKNGVAEDESRHAVLPAEDDSSEEGEDDPDQHDWAELRTAALCSPDFGSPNTTSTLSLLGLADRLEKIFKGAFSLEQIKTLSRLRAYAVYHMLFRTDDRFFQGLLDLGDGFVVDELTAGSSYFLDGGLVHKFIAKESENPLVTVVVRKGRIVENYELAMLPPELRGRGAEGAMGIPEIPSQDSVEHSSRPTRSQRGISSSADSLLRRVAHGPGESEQGRRIEDAATPLRTGLRNAAYCGGGAGTVVLRNGTSGYDVPPFFSLPPTQEVAAELQMARSSPVSVGHIYSAVDELLKELSSREE